MRVLTESRGGRRWAATGLIAALCCGALTAAPTAAAEPRGDCQRCGPIGGGEGDGTHLESTASIRVEVDGRPVTAPPLGGGLTSADPDWKPPACWYEPSFSPEELQERIELVRSLPILGEALGHVYDTYFDNDQGPYQNYNLDQQGEGVFYAKVVHPDRDPDDPEAQVCDRWPFFVEFGEDPGDERAVNPRIMAEYAYDRVPIPRTEIAINPSGVQKVNLATWIWSEHSDFAPVSAVATLDGTPYRVTTTATPTSLRISPGTEDARLHVPAGGCEIRADGSIGERYTPARKGDTPPCGVTYLRSTTGQAPYELTASVTWEVTWSDSVSGQVNSLPDGTFETTETITVEEIQTVVRDH